MKNNNIQTEHMANVTYEICKNLYDKDGASAVYDYCDKIKRKYHYCEQCECNTPTIQSIKLCMCAVCGQSKSII